MSEKEPTICANCAHYRKHQVDPSLDQCAAPSNGTDYVRGGHHLKSCAEKNRGDCPDFKDSLPPSAPEGIARVCRKGDIDHDLKRTY